jgi:hypothetical protein
MLGHHCLNGIPEVPGNMSAGFTGFTPIKGKTLFMRVKVRHDGNIRSALRLCTCHGGVSIVH